MGERGSVSYRFTEWSLVEGLCWRGSAVAIGRLRATFANQPIVYRAFLAVSEAVVGAKLRISSNCVLTLHDAIGSFGSSYVKRAIVKLISVLAFLEGFHSNVHPNQLRENTALRSSGKIPFTLQKPCGDHVIYSKNTGSLKMALIWVTVFVYSCPNKTLEITLGSFSLQVL